MSLIIETARHWIGVPFRHQGRSLKDGVDCLGLIFCVGVETKLMRRGYDYTNYGHDPTWDLLLQIMRDAGYHSGSGSIFSTTLDGHNTPHLGIMMSEGTFIHSSPLDRQVVEQSMESVQPIEYYRFPLEQ